MRKFLKAEIIRNYSMLFLLFVFCLFLQHYFYERDIFFIFYGYHIHLNFVLAGLLLIGVIQDYILSVSTAVIAGGFLYFTQRSLDFYDFLILTAALVVISLFSVSFFRLTDQIKKRLFLYVVANTAFLFISFTAGDLALIISDLKLHEHFLDVSNLVSNSLNAIITILAAHFVYTATGKIRKESFIALSALRPSLIFIILIIILIIFGSQQYILVRELNANYLKVKKNIQNDGVKEAYEFKIDLLNELDRIHDSGRFLTALPGFQWRLMSMIPPRLKEFIKLHRQEGVESVALLSESGDIEIFAGKKLRPEEVKIARDQSSQFPLFYKSQNSIKAKVAARRINGIIYFYFVYPVYQIDPEPNKGTAPDFKRKGFVMVKLDAELTVRGIQSGIFDGVSVPFTCFSVNKETALVSYASDVLLSSVSKKAFQNFTQKLISENSERVSKEIKLGDSFYFLFLEKDTVYDQEFYTGILYPLEELETERRRINASLDFANSFMTLLVFLLFLVTFAVVTSIGETFEKEVKKKQEEITEMISKKFEFAARVLEDLPFGVLLVNDAGDVVLGNVFGRILLEKNLGKSDDIRGTKFFDLKEKLGEKGIVREELIIKDRVLGVTVITVEFDNEKFYLYALSDITEVRAFQQAAIIESRMLALGKLVESYSHQINNPLQVALSNLELLLMKENLDEEQRKLVRSALESLKRISSATKSIIQLQTPLQTEKSVFDLNDLLEKLVKIISHSAEASGITIELKLEKGDLLVKCVQSRIEEAILSILANAVEVLSNYEGIRRIRVVTRESEGNAVVEIEDSGPGIPGEIIDQIFDPFFTTKTKGTGLGLFLCRQMIELEGGNINVISEEGRGTIFIIRLKLYQKS
jgi:signal transduction histidine kinase